MFCYFRAIYPDANRVIDEDINIEMSDVTEEEAITIVRGLDYRNTMTAVAVAQNFPNKRFGFE